MSDHTPGPWVVEAAKLEGYVIRAQGQANLINPGTGWRFVVDPIDCDSRAHWRVLFGAIPREDEARLIAAAPDLLEALENLLKVYEGEGGTQYHAGDMARAAIAKAKGEE